MNRPGWGSMGAQGIDRREDSAQPKRTQGRQPGETYADAIARLLGELRATELDRDRLAAENAELKRLLADRSGASGT